MKRPAVFAAVVALLLGVGFGVGYWSRSLQPVPSKPEPDPVLNTGSRVRPEPEPKVVVESDDAAAAALGEYVVAYRFSGGPVTIRLRVYVDFVENGVRKRAVYRAEDFAPPLPNETLTAKFA